MRDKLGDEVDVGDYVFYGGCIFLVKKITPKMLAVVKQVPNKRYTIKDKRYTIKDEGKHIYPNECVKLDPEKVLLYFMRNGVTPNE